MYGGAEPSPFQYDPDLNGQAEDIFSTHTSTGNPCQSYGRYDPNSLIFPPSSSTGGLGMEHGVEPYQQWLDPYFISQHFVPNMSSTFPGNSDNDIFEFTGNLTMTSANDENTLTFPTYDLHGNYYM